MVIFNSYVKLPEGTAKGVADPTSFPLPDLALIT
jgi:hypothetical protein